ncbi:MAG: hypothetical protein IKJ05_00985 [Oscillospiraceae bacterium]|nr:hypothetical protein [Oscillospiraceae bacterium]
MSNSEIRSRAMEIYKASFMPLLILSAINAVTDIIGNKSDSVVLAVILGLISIFINIGGYYILMRGWIEGQMDLNHLFVPFRSPVYSRKILPIILMETLIIFTAGAPLIFLLIKSINDPFALYMNGALLIILLILLVVVAVAISLVWYIFILEPELKVTEMFRRSCVYMSRHWLGEFIFNISIMIVPVIITMLLQNLIGENALKILLIPVEAYISVAVIGYVYESILMVEKDKELQTVTPDPVAAIEQAETPAVEEAAESIKELTERLTEEAEKDIELQLSDENTEENDNIE